MSYELNYVTDSAGKKTSVLIPLEVWETLLNENDLLNNKLQVMNSIIEGFDEIDEAKKTGKKLTSLSEFLDECNN
jgi:hypothetical protein